MLEQPSSASKNTTTVPGRLSQHLHEPEQPSTSTPLTLERSISTPSIDEVPISSPTKRRRVEPDELDHVSTSALDLAFSEIDPWHPSPHTGWTPTALANVAETLSYDDSLHRLEPNLSYPDPPALDGVSESLSAIYLETPVWPLSDREQAKLLRNYVEHIARNFDLCDPYRHFRTVVPQRAAICPTLLNAIFALSARHLSRTGDYDPFISDRYHQECLKHLIPMLDDSAAAVLDENLLASTIILRHLEEIELPLSGQSPTDQSSHLLGAHAFITAQERATVGGGLRQAAFWVGLRQEIYVAFVNQRSIMPALEHCNIDRSFEAAPDHVWACRMVVQCADVIRYCFGDDDHSTVTYNWLLESTVQWHDLKPSSFTPVFFKEADDENVFPDIWFLSDEITAGWQYYYIARILLCAHNPKLPRLGSSRVSALRAMDEEIKEHVLVLCGIATSNPDTASNFTYASMAITLAGDRFTKRHEQEALLHVLNTCDTHYGWPTGHAQENLRAAWNWAESV